MDGGRSWYAPIIARLRRRYRAYKRPRKLSPEKAALIRNRYFNREATQCELAREFGCAQNTISRAISEQTWSN